VANFKLVHEFIKLAFDT